MFGERECLLEGIIIVSWCCISLWFDLLFNKVFFILVVFMVRGFVCMCVLIVFRVWVCFCESNVVFLEVSVIILNLEFNWDVGGFVCYSVEREREWVGECLYKSGMMCLYFVEGVKRMWSLCVFD